MDGPFFIVLTKTDAVAEFSGQSAGDGKRFLVLRVTVANTDKAGEYFQPREQLKS